jgi:ketosteroid isomerase-like protein
MSRADVETLRAGYEAVSRGDWDAALRETPATFELKTPDTNPIAGTYRGPEEVRRFFEELWAAFAEVAAKPERFVDLDDRILVSLLMRLRPIDSTATLEMRTAHLWTLRDGEMIRCEVFTEREDALEAAGLSEKDITPTHPDPRSAPG